MTEPIKINQKYHLTPREAFDRVGSLSYGPDWSPDCIENDTDAMHEVALDNLYAVFQSNQVSCFWRLPDEPWDELRKLDPQQAYVPEFRINLKKNCIHLAFFAGEPVDCFITADELIFYIRSQGDGSEKLTASAEVKCYQWLKERFETEHHQPSRAKLLVQALAKFPGLSKAAFGRARKRAIEETGADHLASPGRRK